MSSVLSIGLYTQDGATGAWANIEYAEYKIEGVIQDAAALGAYPFLVKLMIKDVKIIRPKQLQIFSNDKALVKNFTRPFQVPPERFELIKELSRYKKWNFYYVENELRKAKEQWQILRINTESKSD